MLTEMRIPFEVLPDYSEGAEEVIQTAVNYLDTRKSPYAILVKRQTFQKYNFNSKVTSELPMNRE